jgi:hypothetical protein
MSSLEQLIIDMKVSLEHEMRSGFEAMATRFDTQAARLERHDWVEKVDAALETKDREIADLRQRLDKIEKRQKNDGS